MAKMQMMTRDEMEASIRSLTDNQEFLEASMKPLAELMHAKLTALVEAGFARDEALQLIMARGMNA